MKNNDEKINIDAVHSAAQNLAIAANQFAAAITQTAISCAEIDRADKLSGGQWKPKPGDRIQYRFYPGKWWPINTDWWVEYRGEFDGVIIGRNHHGDVETFDTVRDDVEIRLDERFIP